MAVNTAALQRDKLRSLTEAATAQGGTVIFRRFYDPDLAQGSTLSPANRRMKQWL